MSTKKPAQKFRVWIRQVNQEYFDVSASDEHEAREKARRKWKREVEPSVCALALLKNPTRQA